MAITVKMGGLDLADYMPEVVADLEARMAQTDAEYERLRAQGLSEEEAIRTLNEED